jgi:hypothetical protein
MTLQNLDAQGSGCINSVVPAATINHKDFSARHAQQFRQKNS